MAATFASSYKKRCCLCRICYPVKEGTHDRMGLFYCEYCGKKINNIRERSRYDEKRT